MMEKDEYEIFREKVGKAFSDTGDRERIGREFEYIEKLGREKYALALSRILGGVRRNLPNCGISGTAPRMRIYGGSGDESIIGKPFNASFSVVWPFGEMIEKDMKRLLCIISRNLRGLELHTEKCVLAEDFMGKTVMVVISEEAIDGETLGRVADDAKSGRDDSPLLVEYLVLTVDAHFGLSVNLGNCL
jgi:hypothetical protein